MTSTARSQLWREEHAPRGIVDGYVVANPPELNLQFERDEYLFHGHEPAHTAAQLVELMDAHGVSRALLAPPPREDDSEETRIGHRFALEAVQQFPDRFGLTVRVNPHEGMNAVRQLTSMVQSDGAMALRLVPMRVGKPLNHKIFFPLYTKCVELGIPVTSTVGIPGPRVPGLMQHPKYLDELCYLWPELTIVTTHGGEPWTRLLVKLMTKWPNLYHMISAFAPRYYPKHTIEFLNTSRGRQKVMFATDYPMISFERALTELPDVPIESKSLPYFLYKNALRVFWGEDAAAEGSD
jgi:hypothetical protein